MEEKITNGWLSNDAIYLIAGSTKNERSTTMSTNLPKESSWLSTKIQEMTESIRSYMKTNYKDLSWEDCEFIATYLVHSEQIIQTLDHYATAPIERA